MTHIDAIKQGLEALELMYACYAHPEWISHKQQEEKILAQCVSTTMSLRQAIKDAEGQEKALQALHNENERLGLYKDAYAEQEPVAWRWKERINGDFDSWVISVSEPPPYAIEKQRLYTSPPQRQPLTDEQRDAIARQADENDWHDYDIIDAVEAAHGITGEQK